MELLQDEAPVRRGVGNGFFVWSVVLLVMTGVCFASWIVSFYIVGHPESPRCYAILKKFKRVEAPKRFAVTEAPKGDFLSATKLIERYGKLGPVELARENELLMRHYLMNFRESGRRVAYVAGRFQVVQSFALGPADWFPSGAVAVTQSENLPQVLVEFVFPAAPENVQAIRETVTMGADISLQRSHDLWALVHVERRADGRMQFTVLPLPYGGWQLKNGQGNFTLRSPAELLQEHRIELNLAAGLPVVRDPRLTASLAEHKDFRRKALARAGDDQAALAGPELIRYEPQPPDVPDNPEVKGAEGAKVSPAPISSETVPAANVRKAQVARPLPTPAPAVPLPPRPIVRSKPASGLIGAQPPAAATPVPTPPPVAASLQPPPPLPKPAGGARTISTAEASGLVDRFSPSEPLLLGGDFVVTGVLGRRVALRTRESLRDPNADPARIGGNAALIVVEFPAGAAIPEKDATINRNAEQGFVIRDVIRGRNGQITIVANERAGD